MKTTLAKIKEETDGEITPEYYYEWGSEPAGFVSTGLYLDNVWYDTGEIRKDEAIKAGLKFHCPYN